MNSTIQIEGMTCKHCVAHVAALVSEFLPAGQFQVNLDKKNIEVGEVGQETIQKIKASINEDGIYKAI